MSDSTGPRARGIMIAVTAGAVAVVAAVAVAIGLSGDSDDGGQPVARPSADATETDSDSRTSNDAEDGLTSAGSELVPEPMGGQEAIDALGDNLARVAEKHDMTPDELRDALLRDDDLRVTPSGALHYADTMTPPPAD